MQLWQAATGIRMCQRCPVASYPLLLSDSGKLGQLVGAGVGIGGSLDNRARWLPLTNTAYSKPVKTLLVEVTSSHVIFETAFHLPSRPQGLFSRSLSFLQKVTWTLVRRPCDVWSWPPGPRLAAKENSGRGGEDGVGWGGNSSSQTPEEDGLGASLKCHHSVVWLKSHPNQRVSYYGLKPIITAWVQTFMSLFSSRNGKC